MSDERSEGRDAAGSTRALRAEGITDWTHAYDVVVVGHGGAGASAAIEAARAGASTLVLERMTRAAAPPRSRRA
jgi:alkyl hydroperoxide reductase subunit AhpF